MILRNMENDLYSQLVTLRDVYGCVGIKSEFENEGSDYRDLILLRYLTAKTGLKLFIKIGGVEAFTDLKMAIHLNADGVVIPMVESAFALVKSQNMIRDIVGEINEDFDVFINIETKTAVEHLNDILAATNGTIKGITIGRSDLSYSYGMKGEQDSDETNVIVERIVDIAIGHGVRQITIGGGISKKTFSNKSLIDTTIPKLTHIETRNVIFKSGTIHSPKALLCALDFERKYLDYKLEKNHLFFKADEARFDTLMSRG